MYTAVALAAALISTPNTQQFDLACSGTMSTNLFGGRVRIPERSTPWTQTYRIDLENGLWCKDECTNILPIIEATAGSLVLMKTADDGFSIWINRVTGKAFDSLRHEMEPNMGGGTIVISSEGPCERKDFTPFPHSVF